MGRRDASSGQEQSRNQREAATREARVIIMMICICTLGIVLAGLSIEGCRYIQLSDLTLNGISIAQPPLLSLCLTVFCIIILTIYFAQLTQLPTHIHYAQFPGNCV